MSDGEKFKDFYNQMFHPARRGDDLSGNHTGHTRRVRQLQSADHAGRQGRGVPAAESAQPLPVAVRRRVFCRYAVHRRARHGMDVLHALQHVDRHGRRAGHARRIHPGLQLDPDRGELHRVDSHAAAQGHDLVPHAAVSLGHLRYGDRADSGYARAGNHPDPADCRTRAGRRDFRSRTRRRPGPVSAASSGSTRTRPCTS